MPEEPQDDPGPPSETKEEKVPMEDPPVPIEPQTEPPQPETPAAA